MDDYENKLHEALSEVIELAKKNKSVSQGIRIETTGNDPYASMTIPAYILEKFIAR